MSRSWGQLPDESEVAYKAFLAYLKLGPGRTVPDAYRQSKGKAKAKQASGVWNGWAKDFRWRVRARDWDQHLAEQAEKAVVREVVDQAEKWARRGEVYRSTLWRPFRMATRHAEKVERQARESGRDVPIADMQMVIDLIKSCKVEALEAILGIPGSSVDPKESRINIPRTDDRNDIPGPEVDEGGRPPSSVP